jgi:glycosyltransferase involved in cell wall biosynthesis
MVVFTVAASTYLLGAPCPPGTVYVGSSPHLLAAFGTWAVARARRRPFVLEVRDLWPESYSAMTGKSTGLYVRLLRWIADLLYRHAELIVVLAAANAAEVHARGVPSERICCIPNGVDLATFVADRLVEAPLSDRGRFTFVYAGAHGPANGLDTVVDACAELVRRGQNEIRVVLLGDGAAKDGLVRRATSLGLRNLVFRDAVPKQQVGPLLGTADAGLMVLAPAKLFAYGVSPNKLFDYLAAGLPVVTNVPGSLASIVLEADAGVACSAGDPDALADAMVTLADNVVGHPSAFRGGRRYVEEHYDRRVLAARFLDELAQVSRARRAARPFAAD